VNERTDGVSAVQSRIADLQRRFAPPSAARTDQTTSRDGTRLGLDGTRLGLGGDSSGLGGASLDFASLLAQISGTGSLLDANASGQGGTTAVGDTRSSAARQRFATDLLQRLGLPNTAQNQRALVAWQAAEGTSAAFNPLATTRAAPGATNLNSVGVKNFRSYEQGLQTTIDTLRNGLYGNILAALRDGTSATRVAHAIADSPWGTGDGVTTVLESGAV